MRKNSQKIQNFNELKYKSRSSYVILRFLVLFFIFAPKFKTHKES